ncbi:hypothetical protein [Novosphingobium sp. 9U]|uniref:hypothetical protein n=1 Tax=Novosphingobium sp. 9U TaxID=2653158 RepID=UPI00135BBDF8|nr:hypothetical protein [Novosphingobium sp. 9U]
MPAPPAAISRMLATFNRHQLEGFIAVAIDLLDLADGNPDEEEGDVEDSFAHSWIALGFGRRVPGDITADADDPAYAEWHTLRESQKKGQCLITQNEDDEEDDPAGQYDEDCYSAKRPAIGGPGCSISDPGGEEDAI